MRCKTCTTVIPHQAKFCPKCGARAATGGPAEPRRAPDALPSTAPIPRIGKVFIALAALGLTLVGLGVAQRNLPLVFFGAGVLAVVALAAVVGHHVS
jgi:hypothetical protein